MTVRSPQREQKRCVPLPVLQRRPRAPAARRRGRTAAAPASRSPAGRATVVHAAGQGVLLEREVAHAVLVGAQEVAVGLGDRARRRTASSPARCAPSPLSSISAWPPETTKTRVVGWLQAAASQASSSRWCAARSMPLGAVRRDGRSVGGAVGPGGHCVLPTPPERAVLVRRVRACSACAGPGAHPRVHSVFSRAPVLREVAPQVRGGLDALEQQVELDLLVGRVPAVGRHGDAEEEHRRVRGRPGGRRPGPSRPRG